MNTLNLEIFKVHPTVQTESLSCIKIMKHIYSPMGNLAHYNMCMLIDLLQHGTADQNLGQGYNTSVSRILTLLWNVWQCIIKEQCKLKNFFLKQGLFKAHYDIRDSGKQE